MAASAPTGRVVDIVELLARQGHEHLRFSDVVQQLGSTQATTHAILSTLCERGWVSRDPVTKTYSLGPALAAVGVRADTARPMTHAARAAAQQISADTGCAASVLERIDDSLIVAFHVGAGDSRAVLNPGDRLPYAPPFGVAFAAWDSDEEQRAWLRRGTDDNDLVRRLEAILAKTRQRGFDVDWITPTLAQTAQMVVALQQEGIPSRMAEIMDRILLECTAIGYLADDDPARTAQPVATIAAPAYDRHGVAALILAVHPFRPLSARATRSIGLKVVAATEILSLAPARSAASSRRGRDSRRTPV